MKINPLQLPNNKYIQVVYISIIAALLLGATVAPSLLRAAAQEDDTRVLEVLCNSYGEGVDISREGRSERISFGEWLADHRPDLVDIFNEVGCAGISGSEEFVGTGAASASVDRTTETIFDCGDADPNTNVDFVTRPGTFTFTGIIDGAATAVNNALTDTCAEGFTHGTYKVRYLFDEVTIAGRTGGAVLEEWGDFEGGPFGEGILFTFHGHISFLCGTGELRGIHGETLTEGAATLAGSFTTYALWVHFDNDNIDEFNNNLCAGLGDN